MSFNAGKVSGKLELNAKDFIDALSRSTKALNKMDKTVRNSGSGFGSFRSKLALVRDLMLVMPGVIRAMTAPLRGLTNFLKESAVAASEYQKAIRNMSVAMSIQGFSSVKKLTKEFEAFARQIQQSTQFSRLQTIEIGKTLLILGTTEDALIDATTAVLDYAAATGRDAIQSAFQFGKTYSGLLGELRETFPVLSVLTPEMLKMGAAFDFTRELLGNFSIQVGETTSALRNRLINTFNDVKIAVGDAINPVLDALTKVGIAALQAAEEGVLAGTPAITEALRQAALKGLDILKGIARTALKVPEFLIQIRIFIQKVVAMFRKGSLDIEIMAKELGHELALTIQSLVSAAGALPDFLGGAGFAKAADEMNERLFESGIALAALRVNAAGLKKEYDAAVKPLEEQLEVAKKMRLAIESNTDEGSKLGNVYRRTVDILKLGVVALNNMEDKTREVEVQTINTNRALTDRLKQLRELTGLTKENLLPATKTMADVIGQAANQTSRMRQEAEGAASAFGQAASSAAGISAGGDFSGGTPGESRTSGGSLGLDLSNVFSSLESLATARQGINRIGGIFGNAQRRSARAVADQIAAVAQGQVNQAMADFNSNLVSELNRLGITDPGERSAFLSQRLAEARRLGTIPPANAVGAAGFGGISFS